MYGSEMTERGSHRLRVTLDARRAAKLAQLAERIHISEARLARLLLSQALDELSAGARNVGALLDALPGALARAQLGLKQARAGRTIDLDEL